MQKYDWNIPLKPMDERTGSELMCLSILLQTHGGSLTCKDRCSKMGMPMGCTSNLRCVVGSSRDVPRSMEPKTTSSPIRKDWHIHAMDMSSLSSRVHSDLAGPTSGSRGGMRFNLE